MSSRIQSKLNLRGADLSDLSSKAATLLICGLLAGVVVAAAAFPFVALAGLGAKAGSEAFGQLPDELTVKRSPQLSYVYASDNKTLVATMYDENRRDLAISEIPLVVQQAIIAAEDQKFYEHNGVDIKGFARAFIKNKSAGEVEQGASTITMQLVRMSINYSAPTPEEIIEGTEDTNARKLREVRYAIALEQAMSKQQILESYLNTAFFGNRAWGIFAASQVYFGKEPKDLKVNEAAFLAGLVKFPSYAQSNAGKGKALDRRDYVLNEMRDMGFLTSAEADKWKAEPLEILGKETPNGCTQATNNNYGFFCDFFQRWWLDQEVFGATPYDRERQLRSGGYRIISSLDVATQQTARDQAEQVWPTGDHRAVMLAGIEPGTGKVRVMAANRYFKLDDKNKPQNPISTNPDFARLGIHGTYPSTTNPLMSPSPGQTGYQPGSVMKTFTMVAALENGYPLDYTINTVSPYVSKYKITGTPNCGGYWCPPAYSGSPLGPQNEWTAFGSSVNTYFVPLFERVGGSKVLDVAKRLGLTFYDDPNLDCVKTNYRDECDDYARANNKQLADGWGPFTLGASTHTPLEIANAWATLANDGVYCEPIPVESITNLKGEQLDVAKPRCRNAVDADVARGAVDAGRCPIGDQSQYGECHGGTASNSKSIIKHNISGKTGTTDADRTATLTITTRQLAVSGFLADPDWARTTDHMSHKPPHGINPAVQNTLAFYMRDKPDLQFNKPSAKMAYGNQVAIPDVACKSVNDAKAIIKNAGFDVQVDDKNMVESPCAPGTVAVTNPSGKTAKGSTVALVISKGGGGAPAVPAGKPTGPKLPKPPIVICPPVCGRDQNDLTG